MPTNATAQATELNAADNLSTEAASEFIENMGLTTEADGLPRIAGRMWGFFIVYDGPVSFAELAERLQVSRGSISTNARILRDLGIIERVGRPGDRQDYYQLAQHPYDSLLLGYIARMKNSVRNVEKAQRSLTGDWSSAQRRLDEMKQFYSSAITATEQLVTTLEEERA